MISVLDSRYKNSTLVSSSLFDQSTYYIQRAILECKWVLFLNKKDVIMLVQPRKVEDLLKVLYSNDEKVKSTIIKEIGYIEQQTKHDVKAIELWVRDYLTANNDKELVHIGLTSEDINNAAYSVILQEAKTFYSNVMFELSQSLPVIFNNSTKFCTKTHGQLATPSTFKEQYDVYQYRLQEALTLLDGIELSVKWGGAVGNHSALSFITDLDTKQLSYQFVTEEISSLLTFENHTTQVSNRDNLCLALNSIKCINNILIDMCTDTWLYLSYGLLVQSADGIGSSVMPNKVNPIKFEQATGCLKIANGLINTITDSISISRMQRDLSDSVMMRQIGMIFGNCELAVNSVSKGLKEIVVNDELCTNELNDNYQVYSELLQTAIRVNGSSCDGYEKVRDLTQGKRLNRNEFLTIVDQCKNIVSPEHYQRLIKL